VSKRYGKKDALRTVDITVPEGSTYLLVGPNGAGKTTFLKMLLDLARPTSGSMEVLGRSPIADGPEVRARIGYVPERHDWGYGWMKVARLLRHHAAFYTAWDGQYADRLTRFFDIPLDQKVMKLSKGQARRVHLVMALAHRPPILLLDEPTDGLDPVMRDETLGLLAEHLAETPTTVLISTHLVHETETLADHIGVLYAGELRAQMKLEEMRQRLRRYRAEVPDGWSGAPALNGSVLRRKQSNREIQWTIWGDEAEIVEWLRSSGATVREASALSLEDATLALLAKTGGGDGL
jgi:ABC-2 type transport system ATP-binding protein